MMSAEDCRVADVRVRESVHLERLPWFHPQADRHIAESLLLQNGIDGAFLLRPSSKGGELALSVRCKESVKHFEIKWNGKEYEFGMNAFTTWGDLIKHLENQPVVSGTSGVLTMLKHHYPRVVEEPNTYETVKLHAELGPRYSVKTQHNFAVGSKEGFLTKRGGNVKNWKTRWFVLVKNDLKYYRERADVNCIRSIDLRQCSECAWERNMDRDNCFKLVLPWRTFYLYGATEDDAKEWFSIINWKLNKIKTEKGI